MGFALHDLASLSQGSSSLEDTEAIKRIGQEGAGTGTKPSPSLGLLNLLRNAAGQTTEFRRKDFQDFQEKQSQNQARNFNLKASLLPSHFPLCALLKKTQNEINQRESASLTDCLFPISSSLQSRMFLRVLFSHPAAHYPDAGLGWLDK